MAEPPKDPLDVSVEPELVKDAQKELSKVDVLICGGCREVFHFVEEFQAHKDGCGNVAKVKCEAEEKPQIWAFSLFKSKEIKGYKSRGEQVPGSWVIYQKWTKLEQPEREVWITAGNSIQMLYKIASAKLTEIKKDNKNVEKDPLAVDEDSGSNEGSKKGVRSTTEGEEYNVEKILGKRFNPRKRYWEYEVKWENYSEHTWEPLQHLENSKELVKEFDEKLKAEKEKLKTPGRGRGRPRLNPNAPSPPKITPKKTVISLNDSIILDSTPGSRPQRSSKQKALNQVKQWCGSISDEETGGGSKRSYDDDDYDSDESYDKKIKQEIGSDTEDEETKPPVRKVAKIIHTYNNGIGKKLPDNVLIPDARGVVRISQKQLPSLSSGVYIMSKSSGIIKLDPTASKIATSGGQAIVKVNPKVGQTQIKIIKKEDGAKRVIQLKQGEHQSPSAAALAVAQAVTASKAKILQVAPQGKMVVKKEQVIAPKKPEVRAQIINVKKEDESSSHVVQKRVLPSKPVAKPPSRPQPMEDDSDDGLPELEFPKDLPPPSPESPPREFTLDPLTGKVAGLEYPSPSPPPVISEVKQVVKNEDKKANDSLDNIVKLAAADITEEDLKIEPEPVVTPPATVVKTVAKSTPSPSILTTAIANSNILQKTLQSPTAKPKTQPRIINQAVAKPRPTMVSPVRAPPPKQVTPRPRYNLASAASPIRPPAKGNVAKRIGNTTVYRTTVGSNPSSPQILRKPVKKPPVAIVTVAPPPVAVAAPKPISMPSLDEESPAAAQVVLAAAAAPASAEPDLSTFTLATSDRPVFITGDDGTVYQVAGQNEEGQTILVTQDSEGQQQCLLVTSEAIQEESAGVAVPTTVEGAVMGGETAAAANTSGEGMAALHVATETADEQPLVAQFIRSEPPSPGGTHKVVVMLPDGDVMVTQVTPEEYASLELDK